MNETSFTYNGVTVQFTEQQKAILLADQNLITQLKNKKISLQNAYDAQEAIVNNAKNQLDNVCNNLKDYSGFPPQYTGAKTNCINSNNAAWDAARAEQSNISNQLATTESQINSAIKKLNDDLVVIQNDIKLQIQAQQANTAAATSAAGNQATVITAPANAAAANEQALAAIKSEAEIAKAKAEQQTKIALFVVGAIVIIVIGFFVAKRA